MKKAYNFIDLKNKKFNRLLVLEYLGKSKWLCECDCGNKIIITSRKIRIGHTKNCGCLQKEIAGKIWSETGKKYGYINGKNNIKYKNLIYDDKYKRLKRIYDAMKNRCKNKNNYCGKKNIQICKEWLNNFKGEVFSEEIEKRTTLEAIKYTYYYAETDALDYYISYIENSTIPESIGDEYELSGACFRCGQCPYFRPVHKADGTPDNRVSWGYCDNAPNDLGRTYKDSRACDRLFEEIREGRIGLCFRG